MKRRNFLIGIGGTALGGSALLGSGAFSRVESQRDMTIQVAEDPDAYLGLSGTGSPNSDNYVSIDDHGHLAIDIADSGHGPGDGGQGVNSDSFTWFDGMVEVCNQGKEEVGFWIEPPADDDFPEGIDATGPSGTPYEDEPRLMLYTGEAAGSGDDGTNSVMGEDNAVAIPLGECIELGVRTMTKGVDATANDQLFGDELLLIADVAVEGEIPVPPEEGSGQELAVNADPEAELESQFDTLSNTEFGTNAVEICVEKAGVDGQTDIGVQVTDHHGTFDQTPTTWNPGSGFLASATIEFEDGTGCFKIGNPGVDGVLFTLFPFGGGLETVDDIDNVAVAVDGGEPDAMYIEGVSVTQNTTATAGAPEGTSPFTEHEAER